MKNLITCILFIFISNTISSQTAYIQVDGEIGLSVYLNDQFKGKTTEEYGGLIIENVAAGKNLIKIVKEGFTPFEEYITVKQGEVFAYKVKPFAKHVVEISEQGNTGETDKKAVIKTGKLIVQSVPIEIKITMPDIEGVDKTQKAKDEWLADKIPIGSYQITFSYGTKIITKTVEIKSNTVTSVFVNMVNEDFTVKNTVDPAIQLELVNYLNKKTDEADGYYRDYSFGRKYFSELKCYSTPNKDGYLTFSYIRNGDENYNDTKLTYTFKISQIKLIEINNSSHGSGYNPYGVSSPIGMIELTLLENSGDFNVSERSYGGTYWNSIVNEKCQLISYPFLQSVQSNLDEIKTEIERVRDSYK